MSTVPPLSGLHPDHALVDKGTQPLLELLQRTSVLPDSRRFLPTMLELAKILRDIDDLGRERAELLKTLGNEFARADEVLSAISTDLQAARNRIRNARTSWLISDFEESPSNTYDLPDAPAKHAVVAVDGSQIMPDKHEVTLCYLINTAGITLYYGTGDRPVAETHPELRFRDQDLCETSYNGKTVCINEKLVGIRRTLAESVQMEKAVHAASKAGIPVVALWDGSLIRWSLQTEPEDYRKRVLAEHLRAFDAARDLGIPIAGYISDPGSKDFINSMRVMLCDQPDVDCDTCPYKDDPRAAPCDAIARLKDSSFLRTKLSSGSRSVLFTSSSTILDSYGDHRILAFYLNVGREIARIEVPQWIAEDDHLLNLVHAVCFDQAQKGRGYPIALAEAHEQAVVKGPERRAFFEMLERSFVKHGARVSHSLKRISKGY